MSELTIEDLFYGMNIMEKKDSVYIMSEVKGFREVDCLSCNCIVHTSSQTTSIDMLKPIRLSDEILLNNLKFRKLGRYTFVKDSIFIHKRKRGFVHGGKNGIILTNVNDLQMVYKNKTKKRLLWN